MIVRVTNSLSKPQLHNLTQLFQVVVDLAVVLVRFKHECFNHVYTSAHALIHSCKQANNDSTRLMFATYV